MAVLPSVGLSTLLSTACGLWPQSRQETLPILRPGASPIPRQHTLQALTHPASTPIKLAALSLRSSGIEHRIMISEEAKWVSPANSASWTHDARRALSGLFLLDL